jgi:hypothetical protein
MRERVIRFMGSVPTRPRNSLETASALRELFAVSTVTIGGLVDPGTMEILAHLHGIAKARTFSALGVFHAKLTDG